MKTQKFRVYITANTARTCTDPMSLEECRRLKEAIEQAYVPKRLATKSTGREPERKVPHGLNVSIHTLDGQEVLDKDPYAYLVE